MFTVSIMHLWNYNENKCKIHYHIIVHCWVFFSDPHGDAKKQFPTYSEEQKSKIPSQATELFWYYFLKTIKWRKSKEGCFCHRIIFFFLKGKLWLTIVTSFSHNCEIYICKCKKMSDVNWLFSLRIGLDKLIIETLYLTTLRKVRIAGYKNNCEKSS